MVARLRDVPPRDAGLPGGGAAVPGPGLELSGRVGAAGVAGRAADTDHRTRGCRGWRADRRRRDARHPPGSPAPAGARGLAPSPAGPGRFRMCAVHLRQHRPAQGHRQQPARPAAARGPVHQRRTHRRRRPVPDPGLARRGGGGARRPDRAARGRLRPPAGSGARRGPQYPRRRSRRGDHGPVRISRPLEVGCCIQRRAGRRRASTGPGGRGHDAVERLRSAARLAWAPDCDPVGLRRHRSPDDAMVCRRELPRRRSPDSHRLSADRQPAGGDRRDRPSHPVRRDRGTRRRKPVRRPGDLVGWRASNRHDPARG